MFQVVYKDPRQKHSIVRKGTKAPPKTRGHVSRFLCASTRCVYVTHNAKLRRDWSLEGSGGRVTGSMNGSSDCGARFVLSTAADYQQMNAEKKQEEPGEFGPPGLKFVLVSDGTPP